MDAQGRAEEIRDQLLAEWPNLYVEVEDGEAPILRLYGARKLYNEQLGRAEALIGQRREIALRSVETVLCSRSTPVKMSRSLGEPSGTAPKPFEEDGRSVWLMCNNEDGHTAHDWDDYEPLPK